MLTNRNGSLNNHRFNLLFLPLLLIAAFIYLHIPLFQLALYAVWYFCCSWWLNPDVDASAGFRPGHHSFPLGPLHKLSFYLFKNSRVGKLNRFLINIIHKPINWIWRIYWKPFAMLFTHRGFIHWPFFGTVGKSVYLGLPLAIDRIYQGQAAALQDHVFAYFTSAWFMIWVLSDALHSLGDYLDGLRRGNKNFIPPAFIAPRGLLYKLRKAVR